jgi:hypothetical protein
MTECALPERFFTSKDIYTELGNATINKFPITMTIDGNKMMLLTESLRRT